MDVHRCGIAVVAVSAIGVLAGCASTPAPRTPSPTPKHLATPTPTAIPTPTATPVPSGPFALAVTNTDRSGTDYDVLLIDTGGRIIARTTAKLPLIRPNQTADAALASASNSVAYFRNGDTAIMSLSPSGATALVKSIPAGSKSIIAFSVSPDDTRIAVSVINQTANTTGSTGRGYAEDLTDSNNHAALWSNTDAEAIRLPVGWHGSHLIDQAGYNRCNAYYNGNGSGNGACAGTASSYHVIDAITGSRTATVCEAPLNPPAGTYDNELPSGMPTSAGIACAETQYNSATQTSEYAIYAVDWRGVEHAFYHKTTANGGPPVFNCFLSPDGSRMACIDNQSSALTLLTPDGKTHNEGRRYKVLGWIDASHLLVDVDSASLAVVNPDSGAVTAVPVAQADKVAMVSTLPGSL